MLMQGPAWALIGSAVLVAATVIHSPLVMHGKFDLERGYAVLAERVRRHCPPAGRVVVFGPPEAADVIHYARREGWALDAPPAEPWDDALARWQGQGAACVAVYLNRQVSPEDEQAYRDLIAALPVLEHGAGPWSAGGRACEYFILGPTGYPPGLISARPALSPPAATPGPRTPRSSRPSASRRAPPDGPAGR
jgi:hypothetical protein